MCGSLILQWEQKNRESQIGERLERRGVGREEDGGERREKEGRGGGAGERGRRENGWSAWRKTDKKWQKTTRQVLVASSLPQSKDHEVVV